MHRRYFTRMTATVYAYPDVGRTGLGNMLFPWARAEVFAHRYGLRIIAPRWTKPRIGPVLRREKDKRLYVSLFDNRRAGYVRGLRRLLALRRAERVDEAHAEAFMQGAASRSGTTIVHFHGYEKWFTGMAPYHNLLPHRELVCRRLREVLSAPVQRRLAVLPARLDIALHVRRGERPPMELGERYAGEDEHGIPQHTRTMPDQWFINVVRNLREVMGQGTPVTIYSDATDAQLSRLLAMAHTARAPDSAAIVDIFMLARARVLVTTGTSSFSAWGAYLGGTPAIWYPDLKLDLIPGRPELAVETDLSGGLPPGAADVIRRAAAAPARV